MTTGTDAGLLALATPIARDFLQTVVVLDDEASYSPVSRPRDGEQLEEPSHDLKAQAAPSATTTSYELDAKTLTDGFARLGLVCSVLVPKSTEEGLRDEVRQTARRADVIILDWTVQGKKGELAQSLTHQILEDDSGADRLRLLAIYTAEPDLDQIAQEVAGALGVTAEGRVIQRESVRIRVFGKNEYSEGQLPDAVVAEFARMIVGLLPMVAVSGMSELRKNTHQLLGRFNYKMDAAYLGQRLMMQNPTEAEQYLEYALVGELQSLIEDRQIGAIAGPAAIRGWLEDAEKQGLNLIEAVGASSGEARTSIVNFVVELLSKGITYANGQHRFGSTNVTSRATQAFVQPGERAEEANQQFAGLLGLKHHYGNYAPRLWLGTIVAEDVDAESRYWVCVQPRCDSTPITDATRFPLLELLPIEPKTPFHPCIVFDHGEWQLFRISQRPKDLRMVRCTPDPDRKEVVAAWVNQTETYQFAHAEGTLRWVGEFKPEAAQRASNSFGAWASRVGMAESDWLMKQ